MKKLIIISVMLFTIGCQVDSRDSKSSEKYITLRKKMIETQIIVRGVKDQHVIAAMEEVPREQFVPNGIKNHAYSDGPLPIGHGQTISQPYIVAFMAEALQLKGNEKVLEIGTGSGYNAAILSKIAGEVYTIEIVEPLGIRSEQLLKRMNYNNVFVRVGDGYKGWPNKAPFDAIILTAAPPKLPAPLVEQLKENGVLVAPIGRSGGIQELIRYRKLNGQLISEKLLSVRFVPMTGRAQDK